MDAYLPPEPVAAHPPRCETCGAAISSGATACDACGTPVATAPVPATALDAAAATDVAAQPPQTPSTLYTLASLAVEPLNTGAATAILATGLATDPEPASEHGEQAEHGERVDGPARRCDWCGAPNTLEAERCASCNAVFPRQEQDDLLMRASRERVRMAMQDIDEADRRHARSLFARLFQ